MKATVPVLQEQGVSIITHFYDILFERYPSVRMQFNMDRHRHGRTAIAGVPAQVQSLANAVLAYAKNIDQIERILPAVERICHKHVSRGVSAEQYDAVGECLIAAIQKQLGDAATEAIIAAWTEAYQVLARTFVEMEKNIREQLEKRAGYQGFQDMKVWRVEEREQGGKVLGVTPINVDVPEYGEGMFVGVKIEGVGMTTMKLKQDQREGLWIEVQESDELASRFLLDEVEVGSILCVSPPAGNERKKIVE